MIDYDKIYQKYRSMGKWFCSRSCMKEVIRQTIPIILKEAAEKAEVIHFEYSDVVDKQSILDLEEELIKKLKL